MYASHGFGSERKMVNSFVVVRVEGDEEEEIWVARVLLLCRCFVRGDTEGMELAFVQYMECVRPLDAVDEGLACVCLRWATTDGREDEGEIEMCGEGGDCTVAGEWFGLIPFQSTLSTVHVIRGNVAVHPFPTELPWPGHRFYINRFFREGGMMRKRLHGED